MFRLRIYTLRSAGALERYATVHWARHVPSLASFGVTTHGIWTQREDLVAVGSMLLDPR
jgi:hypothetical protein